MQKLWGTIRSTQTIIYPTLTNIPLVFHVHLFVKGVMEFATIDVLNIATFYQDHFDMEPTPAFNQKFNELGIETKNFLQNSGSFFAILIALWAWHVIRFWAIFILRNFKANKIVKKVKDVLVKNRNEVSLI